MSNGKKIILWLISPYVLLVAGTVVVTLASLLFPPSIDSSAINSADPLAANAVPAIPVAKTIMNIIGYLIGGIAIILIPVSVIKAILIATKKPAPVAPVVPLTEAGTGPVDPTDLH